MLIGTAPLRSASSRKSNRLKDPPDLQVSVETPTWQQHAVAGLGVWPRQTPPTNPKTETQKHAHAHTRGHTHTDTTSLPQRSAALLSMSARCPVSCSLGCGEGGAAPGVSCRPFLRDARAGDTSPVSACHLRRVPAARFRVQTLRPRGARAQFRSRNW